MEFWSNQHLNQAIINEPSVIKQKFFHIFISQDPALTFGESRPKFSFVPELGHGPVFGLFGPYQVTTWVGISNQRPFRSTGNIKRDMEFWPNQHLNQAIINEPSVVKQKFFHIFISQDPALTFGESRPKFSFVPELGHGPVFGLFGPYQVTTWVGISNQRPFRSTGNIKRDMEFWPNQHLNQAIINEPSVVKQKFFHIFISQDPALTFGESRPKFSCVPELGHGPVFGLFGPYQVITWVGISNQRPFHSRTSRSGDIVDLKMAAGGHVGYRITPQNNRERRNIIVHMCFKFGLNRSSGSQDIVRKRIFPKRSPAAILDIELRLKTIGSGGTVQYICVSNLK